MAALKVTRTTYRYAYPDGSVKLKTVLCCPQEGCAAEFEEFSGLASHTQEAHGLPLRENSLDARKARLLWDMFGEAMVELVKPWLSQHSLVPEDIHAAIAAADAQYDQKKLMVQNLARSGADRDLLAKEPRACGAGEGEQTCTEYPEKGLAKISPLDGNPARFGWAIRVCFFVPWQTAVWRKSKYSKS
eukprot:s1385_g1.t1